MARGRMLNKTVCASLKFQELPDDTCRLLATWIIPHLDKNGVFYADPAMVKSYVFPRRSDITTEQIQTYLDCLVYAGLIVYFEAKGDIWQHWPGFADNQSGLRADRETTDFPNPPQVMPDECRIDAGLMPATSPPKGSEKNLIEGKENGADAPPAPDCLPPEKPRQTRTKTPPPPAVQVYRENASRYPPKSWYGRIDAAVGTAERDLKFWGDIVMAYIGCGWNPGNVKTMLEFFERKEIPGGHKDGKGPALLPTSIPVREYT